MIAVRLTEEAASRSLEVRLYIYLGTKLVSFFFFGSKRPRISSFPFVNLDVISVLFSELERDFSQVFIVFAGLEPKSFQNLFPFWEDRPDVAKINRSVSTSFITFI